MADIGAGSSTQPQIGVQSYVEWGAVIGGSVAALATGLVLLNFGAAIGLASVSPFTSTTTGLKAVGVGAAFWFLLVTVWSFALGGYLAGRLRHRWNDASANEVEFRDSAHGLLVWSLAVLVGAVLATSGLTAASKGLAGTAGSLTSTSDPIIATSDLLLRTEKPVQQVGAYEVRAEIARLLARSIQAGEVTPPDRTYLAQVVAARTGIPQADAEKRVDEAVDSLKTAVDRARRIAVILGFLTASILLIGGATAWWAAALGGSHRDSNKIWHGFTRVERFW
jgi:hypothetical protein